MVPKDSVIVWEGYLGKVGKKSSLLVNRYYILRDHALFIYQNREQRVPSNVIFLRGIFINEIKTDKWQDMFGFSLSHENKQIKARNFYQKSESSIARWIQEIKE